MAGVKVSTRGDYASRALLSLALHRDDPRPTSVRDIAERTGLPQPYLEQILLALKGAGLVRSKRGVGGGYVLARPAAEAVAKSQGTVEVGPWMDAEGHLDPMVAYDQHASTYTLNLENRGNVPIS